MEKEVMSACESGRFDALQQNEQKKKKQPTDDRTSADDPSVLIHGLSVERYRDIYQSVLQPPVLAALSSAKKMDYVCQVLELKQQLWTALGRPCLQETLGEDGQVEVTEICDLT